MKNKKWLLLLIILIPSLMWVILETSTINSYKLHFYGPKKIIAANDTIYYRVPDDLFLQTSTFKPAPASFTIDSAAYPLYAIMFIKNRYVNESYRVAGLWEYLNYKKEKIGHIPVFLISEQSDSLSSITSTLQKFTDNPNVHFLSLPKNNFDSINHVYFTGKPIHIDYSFFVLVDSKRNIRGYYDGRFVAEIKRLIDEYKHLRLKEEKQKLINDNEVKSNS
ncbi:MAG: hypothetical protein H0W61_02750 [Bacteroidetes bacterium]|nr:hypothetical protein [Bacteroidota bacterium]